MKKILVTGGSGFIGTNLISELIKLPDVIVLNVDLVSPRCFDHAKYYHSVDICDFNAFQECVEQFSPDYIFHLAARTDLDGTSLDAYQANTTGVKNLIDIIANLVKKPAMTVFASSRLVCEIGYQPKNMLDYCPTTFYGQSKVIGEQLVHEFASDNFKWCIVRPTSIWGPWFDVPYRNFFDAISKSIYFHPFRREIFKSFGYVGNSVFQLINLCFSARETVYYQTSYLCDYLPLEVGAWGDSIASQMQVRKPRRVPLLLLKSIAYCGDVFQFLFKKSAPLTSFRLNNILTEMIHDTALLENVVGKLPFTTEAGIRLTLDWMSKNTYASK